MVVAKFYRPGRWSDAQILEEHAFAAELAAAEIPVAASLAADARSRLAARRRRRPRRGDARHRRDRQPMPIASASASAAPAARPSSTTPRCSALARPLHRPAARRRRAGRLRAPRSRSTSTSYGAASRDWLLGHDIVPPDSRRRLARPRRRGARGLPRRLRRRRRCRHLRLHGDCHLGNVLWTERGPHFVDLDDAVNGPAMQDLWMLLSGDRAADVRPARSTCSRATSRSWTSTGASCA